MHIEFVCWFMLTVTLEKNFTCSITRIWVLRPQAMTQVIKTRVENFKIMALMYPIHDRGQSQDHPLSPGTGWGPCLQILMTAFTRETMLTRYDRKSVFQYHSLFYLLSHSLYFVLTILKSIYDWLYLGGGGAQWSVFQKMLNLIFSSKKLNFIMFYPF